MVFSRKLTNVKVMRHAFEHPTLLLAAALIGGKSRASLDSNRHHFYCTTMVQLKLTPLVL